MFRVAACLMIVATALAAGCGKSAKDEIVVDAGKAPAGGPKRLAKNADGANGRVVMKALPRQN